MNLRSRNKVEVGFSMSSMTDIIFLLLIFFIIASTLITEHSLKINLPGAESIVTEKSKPIIISAIDENQIEFQGKMVSKDEIDGLLKRAKGDFATTPTVKFLGDKDMNWELGVFIMDKAKQNGYEFVIALK